jgi:uncharacterized protein YkwD
MAENPKNRYSESYLEAKIPKLFFNRHLFFLLALLASFTLTISLLQPKTVSWASDLTVPTILGQVNKERTERNLIALNDNNKLQTAAQQKATDMIIRHYFSHTDPEGNYLWPRIVAQGYTPYLQLGENLAIEFYSTESLVAAWMNSPTHRANILNENFKDQGMGLDFGDVQKNQYHSAIVNTFGAQALAPAKVKGLPAPSPALKPQPENPAPALKQTKATAPAEPKTQEPQSQQQNLNLPAAPKPLAIRGEENQPAFTVPQSAKTNLATSAPAAASPQQTKAPAASQSAFNPYKLTKNFLLVFGFFLLVILAMDLSSLIRAKIIPIDKKINNLAVLIISLLVIALMYWF